MNDVLLTAADMLTFNNRLEVITKGRLQVEPEAISRGQARALWAAVKSFSPSSPPPAKLRAPHRRRREVNRSGAVAVIGAAAAVLSGCTTLGGNVKGDFACRAPDGMCAPTSKIDDQALAMISGNDIETVPTGIIDPNDRPVRRLTPVTASASPERSNEKVLRIVFPAHVDRYGRYREVSAIHTVVERGTWLTAGDVHPAAVMGMAPSNQQFALADQAPSLAELAAASPEVVFAQPDAAQVVPSSAAVTAISDAEPNVPNVPSAALVAAARRRMHAAKAVPVTVRPAAAPARAVVAAQASAHAPTRVQLAASATAQPAPLAAARPDAPVSLVRARSAPAPAVPAAVSPVMSFDLRAVGAASSLQTIRDQVGSIFAVRGTARGTPAATAKPGDGDRPVNGPSVLAVSGVGK